MLSKSDYLINIAATCVGTRALGPGLRSVVWVQGCPFRCSGCLSPQWIPIRNARLVPIDILVEELLINPLVDGLTLSGGEPFLQAAALSELVRQARKQRELSLICFTGYQLADLRNMTAVKGVEDLLSMIDVLIDGPYIAELDDNRGMRGSSNQVIHHLTDRLKDYNFETQPRQAEIRISDGDMLFVGVPPQGIIPQVDQEVRLNSSRMKVLYEWT